MTRTVAVFPNSYSIILIGNDLTSGVDAMCEIVMMSARHSAYMLADKKGSTGLVHCIK